MERELIHVSANASLGNDYLINQFKRDLHLAFFCEWKKSSRIKNPLVGIITLQDLVEEILQTEINDETVTVSDDRKKRTNLHMKNHYKIA